MSGLLLTPTGTVFDLAGEAMAAAIKFDASTPAHYQYEFRAVFGGGDRRLEGYTARVMDMDGFGVGYVTEREGA